jgi:hypothetical protein
VTYTDASRARLVLSFEACELSDLARAMVPIDETTAALADAAEVLVAARRFLDAAVVVERTGGASWQLIGDGWRTYMVREPLEAAEDLDDWVGSGGAPVSGGLG